jgi:hypothetical protein
MNAFPPEERVGPLFRKLSFCQVKGVKSTKSMVGKQALVNANKKLAHLIGKISPGKLHW